MSKKRVTLSRAVILSISIVLLAIIFSPLPAAAQKKSKKKQSPAKNEIVLAENEASRYRIVVPSAATEHEIRAADVLQKYVLQISGTAIPIVAADKAWSRYEILLGQNDRLDELNIGLNLNTLKEDGFLIKTDSMRLIIAGGNEKGTLYGVYTFLEKYLGCRMYSPTVKTIPKQKRISLGSIMIWRFRLLRSRYALRVTWMPIIQTAQT